MKFCISGKLTFASTSNRIFWRFRVKVDAVALKRTNLLSIRTNSWSLYWNTLCSLMSMQFIPRQDINADATFPGPFARCAIIPTLRRLIILSQNNIVTQKLPPYHSHVREIGLPVLLVRGRAHEHNPADFPHVRKWFIIWSQTSWCTFAVLVGRW